MNIIVLIIMAAALYLLYRIAFPKRATAGRGNDTPPKRGSDNSDVVGKSRFVLPDRSKPLQTLATSAKDEPTGENAITFAAGNEKRNAVVLPEKLDEVFGNEGSNEVIEGVNPDDLDIEPDENEPDGWIDEDEEAEELRLTLGRDAEPAAGMTVKEMTETVEAIEQPIDDRSALLYRVEKTDMFEQLVSGDEGKQARIKAIVERYVRSLNPQAEHEAGNSETGEWENFDISSYLS